MDARSERNLEGVHTKLVAVVRLAAQAMETRTDGLAFIVTEGRRTRERQAQLLKAGATRTLASKHLTGHAVDLAATVTGQVRWDWPLYASLAETMKRAATDLGIRLTWGGDWKSFRDGPHFELDPSIYPAEPAK